MNRFKCLVVWDIESQIKNFLTTENQEEHEIINFDEAIKWKKKTLEKYQWLLSQKDIGPSLSEMILNELNTLINQTDEEYFVSLSQKYEWVIKNDIIYKSYNKYAKFNKYELWWKWTEIIKKDWSLAHQCLKKDIEEEKINEHNKNICRNEYKFIKYFIDEYNKWTAKKTLKSLLIEKIKQDETNEIKLKEKIDLIEKSWKSDLMLAAQTLILWWFNHKQKIEDIKIMTEDEYVEKYYISILTTYAVIKNGIFYSREEFDDNWDYKFKEIYNSIWEDEQISFIECYF